MREDLATAKKRGVELKPPRDYAYKIGRENPGITASEMKEKLGEKGFIVNLSTVNTWLSRCRKAARRKQEPKHVVTLSPADKRQRGIELKPAREYAHRTWEKYPDINRIQLSNTLKRAGYVVNSSTVNTWLSRWRRKRQAHVPVRQAPVPVKQIRVQIPIQIPVPELTWEQVIKAFPDRATLASYLFDGALAAVNERNKLQDEINRLTAKNVKLSETVESITEDRKGLMQELNHYIAKEKGIVFGIDHAKRILVPKKKGD